MTERLTRRRVIEGSVPLFLWRGGVGTGAITTQNFSGASLSGTSFTTGSLITIGNVLVSFSPPSPDATGVTMALDVTSQTNFQLTNGGAWPCALQAKATCPPGTYSSIQVTLTKAGVANSPQTYTLPSVVGTASGATPLYNLTAVNDSAGTLTAGNYFLFRNLAFKDGDLTAGTYPTLKVSGVTQPYTPCGTTSWPSGAVKMMSVLIRPTFNLTAAATQAIGVFNGGSAPAASGRALADLYAQSLSVQAAAASPSGANVTGTWGAWVNGDANQFATYTIGDGQAGLVVATRHNMATGAGGTPHGQLVTWVYSAILNDASGNLGAVAFLARITQPYWDVNSPAKNFRAFASANYQYGAGPTSLPFPLTFSPNTIAWTSGNNFTCSGSNFYQGASAGNDGQLVPGYLTTTGAIPTGLDGNTIYFLKIASAAATTATLQLNADGGYAASATAGGSGTLTFNPVLFCGHFGSIFGASAAADWQIVQGTGSISSPAWCRANLGTTTDQNYWRSSKVLPPFDTSLYGTISNGTFTYGWNPASIGNLFRYQEASGGRADIGWLTGQACRHFYTQSKTDELIIKCIGYAGAFEYFNFRDSTSKNLINLSNTSYTGMAAPSATQRGIQWIDGASSGSWTAPPVKNGGAQFFDQNESSHCPEFAGYAYIVTGRPEFADIMAEMGIGAMLQYNPTNRNPTTPATAYGITTGFAVQPRSVAWAYRNIVMAAGVMPDTHYDGSQVTTYLRAQAAASSSWVINHVMPGLGTYCNTKGLWIPWDPVSGEVCRQSAFETGYFLGAAALHSQLLGDTNAASILANGSMLWSHVLATFGGWSIYQFIYHSCLGYGFSGGQLGTGPITSDAQFAATPPSGGTDLISWGTSSPAFDCTHLLGSGWTALNANDKIMLDSSGNNLLPTGTGNYAIDTPYYPVNISGNKCDFSLSVNGSAITAPSTSGSQNGGQSAADDGGPWCSPHSTTANTCPTGIGADSYITEVYGAMRWAKFLGISPDPSPVISDASARISAASPPVNWNDSQQWATASS